MELEINKSHKKIDLSKIKQPLKKITAGTLIGLCLFSGVLPITVEATTGERIEQQTNDIEVKVPDNYRFNILFQLGKQENDSITKRDLEAIKYLNLTILDSNDDLSFLEDCTNLEALVVICNSSDSLDKLANMPSIQSLRSLAIYNLYYDMELNQDNIIFLENNPSIKNLEIDGILLVPGVEEGLNKLETLRLGAEENIDIDFSKLTNLKELDLREIEPYTLAMYLSTEDYNALINNGVKITFEADDEEKYLNASKKIDEIVASLNVDENSTDKEKLDAILIYTLENLEYDMTVANATSEEIGENNLTASFYEEGLLYGALEKDTAICGNYTALVEALSKRLGNPTDSFYLTSNNHAWNLMNIDGELYYVDATWLDSQLILEQGEDSLIYENNQFVVTHKFNPVSAVDKIKEGKGEEVSWYMEDPTYQNISELDKTTSHIPAVKIPDYMYEEDQNNIGFERRERGPITSSQKVKIKVADKKVETSLGAIIGAMVAFGTAVSLKNKKNKEQARKQSEQKRMMDDLNKEESTENKTK